VVRGTRPHQRFDPVEVTKEYAALLKQYRISTVTGDYYGAEWVAGAWRSTGILVDHRITSPMRLAAPSRPGAQLLKKTKALSFD
jgi:hypothetical protein